MIGPLHKTFFLKTLNNHQTFSFLYKIKTNSKDNEQSFINISRKLWSDFRFKCQVL